MQKMITLNKCTINFIDHNRYTGLQPGSYKNTKKHLNNDRQQQTEKQTTISNRMQLLKWFEICANKL